MLGIKNKKISRNREITDADDVLRDQSEKQPVELSEKENLLLRLTKHRHFASVFYIIAGLFLFISFAIIFFTHVLRLKVETAVVSADIEEMVAPMSGYVSEVFVSAGAMVKKGDPLLKIENIELDRELQLARARAAEYKLNINYYHHLLNNEQQRLKIYKKIGNNRVTSAKALVNMAKQELLSAQQKLDRYTVLYKKHFVSKAELDLIVSNSISAKEKLRKTIAQQHLQHHALKAVDEGMYFTGTKTEGIERDLFAELEAAKERGKLNDDRVNIYKNIVSKLTLKAPFNGKVVKILKSESNTADNVKPIIFIERSSSNKSITAYLTQDEIIKINAVKPVKIYVPASGEVYHGKIVEINRTDGFVDEIRAQYRWRDFAIDRSAIVKILVQDNDQTRFANQAFSGMPVIVYFTK